MLNLNNDMSGMQQYRWKISLRYRIVKQIYKSYRKVNIDIVSHHENVEGANSYLTLWNLTGCALISPLSRVESALWISVTRD